METHIGALSPFTSRPARPLHTISTNTSDHLTSVQTSPGDGEQRQMPSAKTVRTPIYRIDGRSSPTT